MPMMLLQRSCAFFQLAFLCLLLMPHVASAQALQVNALAEGAAGLETQVLQEQNAPLELEQAVARFQQGHGKPGESPILNFGIGSPPIWLQLQLFNPTAQPIQVQVVTGKTWVDSLQLSLLQNATILSQWQSGDSLPGAKDLVPGIGYVASMLIPSGHSQLYLRAESPDPLVLPIEVMSEKAFLARHLEYRFVYGLIYGFLLSMIVYNSMLFIGLRDRSYFYYSLYLALFTLLNFTYTGHGFAWIWPDDPQLQKHSILIAMVLFGCSGLLFTSSFLSLAELAPKSLRLLQALAALAIASQIVTPLLGEQAIEVQSAFAFDLLAAVSMLLLGLKILKHRRVAGSFYLAATFCGLIGLLITTLTVWGTLPFTGWNYGAIKIGIILQAILLALGLSQTVRKQNKRKLHAERLAERDPLTALNNRRGFNEQAAQHWNTAVRNNRPLSLIMLDLDHFKTLNDLHGHAAGDHALELIARLLEKSCRSDDVIARWGGEEFLLMLPETAIAEAQALAERLRREIQTLQLGNDSRGFRLTASFGVIERSAHNQLEQMINQADRLLYAAKHSGRNRVCAEA